MPKAEVPMSNIQYSNKTTEKKLKKRVLMGQKEIEGNIERYII